LISWVFCNRGRVPGDTRFPGAVLVVCPNLTVKERLQVLRPELAGNYYEAFDIVPSQLMPELQKGKVLVTNWHAFALESPHAEGGRSYVIVNKGEESPEAFARRILGDLYEHAPLMVLNDEAHHAYRPAAVDTALNADEKAEREEATVWVRGLDKLNQACDLKLTVDLSATPFYLHGSGYVEGSPFPWLVSDFGLVDAIESGIVKIPCIPVSDTTGRPDPKFFALWKHITESLQPGEKLPGGKPKPEVVWREAEDALKTLASQWKERFSQFQEAAPGQERVPPVLIVVGDNTEIAELFYRNISGEEMMEVATLNDGDEDQDDENGAARKPKKPKARVIYGKSKLIEEFVNREGFKPTLRIDPKLLAQAESEDPQATRSEAAEALRKIVDSVGKPGQAGEKIRCVVSVQMLTEGWDANNVTHILGRRAFGSQLLCEQVVGRGLRRLDYTVDPTTGLLTEEYVDIYGIPFSVIPFKGRPVKGPPPDDRPKNHVQAMEERAGFEIRFPVVENYVVALQKNLIKADVRMEPLILQPDSTPTAVFVKPQVGYQMGSPKMGGGFQTELQDREEYHRSTHLQTIKFEIARRVVWALTEGAGRGTAKLRLRSRHLLFPQVYRLVEEYGTRKVDFHGCHACELGLEKYVVLTVERLIDAFEPDDAQGEPPLLPILNRYKPIGSTAEVNFKTTRPCHATVYSHLNQVVLDTQTWEQSAAFYLEKMATTGKVVRFYARNDHLEFSIPYEYLGVSHAYVPDYVVRFADGTTLFLEIKGHEDDQDRAKHQAAKRWLAAVN
jgi:type III restriction enzyme